MTKETIELFKELLAQVRPSPYQPDADAVWARIRKACQEVDDELAKTA